MPRLIPRGILRWSARAAPGSVRGLTLQDLLLILGVTGFTTVGLLVVFPMVQAAHWASSTHAQLTELGQRLDSTLAAQWTTDKARQADLFPKAWMDDDPQAPTSAWGGAIALSETPLFQPVVVFTQAPPRVCRQLVVNVPAGWSDVRINGQPYLGDVARQTACRADSNTVVFVHQG